MKAFMDDDFLLQNETARKLFHSFAETQPLIDYHCHISPQEIYEDRRFDNITQVWLGGRGEDGTYFGDHYKWRLMRWNGASEDLVTGSAAPFDRFYAFAEALEMAIGNPMYHWANLELKTYFGITEPLTTKNARAVFDRCNDLLRHDPELSVRGLIRRSRVAYVGTTDDPADSLKWHEKIAADEGIDFLVCPSFRPDKAINITKPGFREYMSKLAASVGKSTFDSAQEVLDALTERLEFFKEHGCRASDHGLDYVMYRPCGIDEADAIFKRAMAGETLSREDAERYQTTVLLHLAKQYHRLGIVMEIHYSCRRDNNARMFAVEGPDTGFDMIAQTSCISEMARLFSALDLTGELPKTILFSLDSTDFDRLAALAGCFQDGSLPGKIQVGAAWWFLDTKDGMEAQMRSLARLGLLGTFVGMLTDSRSFLSYTRHEYFRRIMCSLIGEWVENGEYPDDEAALRRIVEGICCGNARRYFGIE